MAISVQNALMEISLLPPDKVIEQTINKEQKGTGGIIGSSTSIGSVQRWVCQAIHFLRRFPISNIALILKFRKQNLKISVKSLRFMMKNVYNHATKQ